MRKGDIREVAMKADLRSQATDTRKGKNQRGREDFNPFWFGRDS
jgi:hypothetical protein